MARVTPVTDEFAARVDELDLCVPDAETLAAIQAAIDRYAVLVFPGQWIDNEQQQALTRAFGEPEDIAAIRNPSMEARLPTNFVDISNLDAAGKVLPAQSFRHIANLSNRLWHTDSSFRTPIARYSILSAREVPSSGGNTEFADLRAAYDALDGSIKTEIEDLRAEHSLLYSREIMGVTHFSQQQRDFLQPVVQPLVRTMPSTGRKTLYLASHASHIVGMPVPDGRIMLHDLMEHATQRHFVYEHRWRPGDVVMWDNRCTMHRGRRYDEVNDRRDLRRTIAIDEVAASGETAGKQRARA